MTYTRKNPNQSTAADLLDAITTAGEELREKVSREEATLLPHRLLGALSVELSYALGDDVARRVWEAALTVAVDSAMRAVR